jgi:hypothetical protein
MSVSPQCAIIIIVIFAAATAERMIRSMRKRTHDGRTPRSQMERCDLTLSGISESTSIFFDQAINSHEYIWGLKRSGRPWIQVLSIISVGDPSAHMSWWWALYQLHQVNWYHRALSENICSPTCSFSTPTCTSWRPYAYLPQSRSLDAPIFSRSWTKSCFECCQDGQVVCEALRRGSRGSHRRGRGIVQKTWVIECCC